MKKSYVSAAILLLVISQHFLTHSCALSFGVVNQPVIDLRVTPAAYDPIKGPDIALSERMFGTYYEVFKQILKPAHRDPQLDSQLVYGEKVRIVNDGPWLEVEAIEQPYFNRGKEKFEPTRGFVRNDQITRIKSCPECNLAVCVPSANIQTYNNGALTVPIGTLLTGNKHSDNSYEISLVDGSRGFIPMADVSCFSELTSADMIRDQVVSCARMLLGNQYIWGGRSTEIDCSGFVNIIYRACGRIIPRNAHCIHKKTTPVDGNQIKPGDLIFVAYKDTLRVVHILLYCGNGSIIQSSTSKGKVIEENDISLFGKPITEIKNGEARFSNPKQVLLFGSLFNGATTNLS